MKLIDTVIFFVVASVCSGDTLRISELADAAGKDVERMAFKTEDGEEALFVKTKAVLGDADVEEAWLDPAFGGQISVKLNEGGGKKLKETTAKMRHGRDRLAIIVDGRLVSAPVVQATLGSTFVISGLQDLEFRDLDDLTRRISGRPPRTEGENPQPPTTLPKIETVPFTKKEYQNKNRLAELNAYWAKVSRAVRTGDFDAYKATCHPEGVLVSGPKKTSYPLTKALAGWKQGFVDTKAGKMRASVDFRFRQRFGDETTAHETGIFLYTATDANEQVTRSFIHFEGLLVKRNGKWKIIMEYQKSKATEEEWKALEER